MTIPEAARVDGADLGGELAAGQAGGGKPVEVISAHRTARQGAPMGRGSVPVHEESIAVVPVDAQKSYTTASAVGSEATRSS